MPLLLAPVESWGVLQAIMPNRQKNVFGCPKLKFLVTQIDIWQKNLVTLIENGQKVQSPFVFFTKNICEIIDSSYNYKAVNPSIFPPTPSLSSILSPLSHHPPLRAAASFWSGCAPSHTHGSSQDSFDC